MATSPGPHEPGRLYDSIQIGSTLFPSDPLEGVVRVKVKTGADVEQQKANGKTAARTNVKGKKTPKVSLAFQFTRRIWETANALRLAIDPGGDNSGKPWEVRHPELAARGVTAVVFTDMGELGIKGDAFEFSVEADGWVEPPAAKLGGTKTPKTATPSAEAADASAIAKQFRHFQEVLAGAGKPTVAADASSGINSAAEAIRRAAAGKDPNPPFQGPEV